MQRRTGRRQMVPRYQASQTGSRYAPPPPAPQSKPPAPDIPPLSGIPPLHRHTEPQQPAPDPKPLIPPELSALLTDFPDRLKRLDGETLLLLGLLWMLWQDKADRKLLIALAYILL